MDRNIWPFYFLQHCIDNRLDNMSEKKERIRHSHFSDFSIKLFTPLSIIRKIIGDRDSFTLENRVFNSLCLVTIASCLVTFYWNNSIGITPLLNIIMGIFLIYYCVLYYFSRCKKTYKSIYYVIPALIALSFVWLNIVCTMLGIIFLSSSFSISWTSDCIDGFCSFSLRINLTLMFCSVS